MHYFDYMISFIVRDIYIACVVGYVAYLKKNTFRLPYLYRTTYSYLSLEGRGRNRAAAPHS